MKIEGISLKDILKTFLRRKWFFIGSLVVILIIGFLLVFLKTPMYKSTSMLKVTEVYYDENLYRYFPEDAESLGIYDPVMKIEDLEVNNLNAFAWEIKSEIFLEEVSKKIDSGITKDYLYRNTHMTLDKINKTIKIDVVYEDPVKAQQINSTLINTFVDNKKSDNLQAIEELIIKADDRIAAKQKEIAELSSSDYTQLEFESKFSSLNMILSNLEEIKYNLESNKEIFAIKIGITQNPNIPGDPFNTDYIRNILITLFVAVTVGLIVVFFPGIFTSVKK